MDKPLPKWSMWRHIPKLRAVEAVALTLNVEPSKVQKDSSGKWVVQQERSRMRLALPEFRDRLFLFTRLFGEQVEMSLAELANWSQSVDWNVPIELAALAPWPPVVYEPASPETIDAAIKSVVVDGAYVAELRREIEAEGWRFTSVDGSPTVHIPDGTVKGRIEPLENLYSLVCGLYDYSKNKRIGNLVRGSGASGSGAVQSRVIELPSLPRTMVPVVVTPPSRSSGEKAALSALSVDAAPPTSVVEHQLSPAERRKRIDVTQERGARRRIIESWDDIEKEYGPKADGHQVLRFLKRAADETQPTLKTVQNQLSSLRKKGLIP